MLEFPSPNWVLVSNSKLTSAVQDVGFSINLFKFIYFSQFDFESLAFFPNSHFKIFKKSQIRLLSRCQILPQKKLVQ